MIKLKMTLTKCNTIIAYFPKGLGKKQAMATQKLAFKGLRKFREAISPLFDARDMKTEELRANLKTKYPGLRGDLPPEFQEQVNEINQEFTAGLREKVTIEVGQDTLEAVRSVIEAAQEVMTCSEDKVEASGYDILMLDEAIDDIKDAIVADNEKSKGKDKS